MTHCQRELLHAQWKVILDDQFLEAYKHGIVIRCSDGVARRFYPRIFTYSADYPEKLVLKTLDCIDPFADIKIFEGSPLKHSKFGWMSLPQVFDSIGKSTPYWSVW